MLDQITPEFLEKIGIRERGLHLKIKKFIERNGCLEAFGYELSGSKVFNDPVHGHMELHPLCVAIIDTPQFQRLRYLKQLGACYFVFPGASNNRFEHSLGVCHLAGQLVTALQRRQPWLNISKKDILCVQIAGLCHDLGHGPFSHVFDNKFIPLVVKDGSWKHEEASVAMFDYMYNDPANDLAKLFKQYGLTDADRIFIKEQVAGPSQNSKEWSYFGRPKEKSFLYEIVANKRNGIDVDKWDYFLRDCHHLGMRNSFDYTRFIHFARVIFVENQFQICVRDKEVFNMYEMFQTRHALHRKAYQHKVTHAVEIMLVEAMKEANDFLLIPGKGKMLKMSECIKEENMDAYMNLNDSIFHQILLSPDPNLQKSKDILQALQRRRLYKCAAESVPIEGTRFNDESVIKDQIMKALTEEEIANLGLGMMAAEERVIVQLVYLDFGMKDKNPANEIRFYSKDNQDQAVPVLSHEVSHLIPKNQFKEQLVRVFLKPSDDRDADGKCLQLLMEAFSTWCKNNKMKEPKKFVNIEASPKKHAPEGYMTPEHPTNPTVKTYSAGKKITKILF
ncbi:deoxynucleoside triphosphate triphosphohydrolase SAMHD1-like isoform X1 [Pomacea canaliculata]|uniref:deoxynucleoside triphosphate triphosphohydrolase SAMHD1-like isoform X1 n=1 Tax=Pomacea canaliculata TaxID=400727 RepID=UPI000D73AD43|nr:deoxynucleoside triphosphate triphosphohydrolase SAMHD1-like isoform X1 [Pomacea canaliculata]XP_025115816.1 deoxynucleoside triphosphate triphosphohydrolase SAMHD1-like isoform X1 [Pomacea canaliculata]XP_025115817.1 deoxynucleoside triphosphate triphosphohydrolase SAMHD1-like isoform X1 [Pomacea canaliculata]XP_025115818.1 deoxynucleoside triphosphate triphosphohydrolase SAMHD1-like isoform X1 [Pomacea canaliculata]XP_025115819.1 deoxynucleoside triphosphate triphosphohydrolase SAMHD1-like